MTRQELASAVLCLCAHFERPEPAAETLDAWFELLAPRPGGQHLAQAVRDIRATEPRFPANLTQALGSLLPRPEPKPHRAAPCPACRGQGVISAFTPEQAAHGWLGPSTAFRCAECGQHPDTRLHSATRAEIRALGLVPRT